MSVSYWGKMVACTRMVVREERRSGDSGRILSMDPLGSEFNTW